MEYCYKTKGTCSRSIRFEMEDGVLKEVQFEGGCNGNGKGISRLVEGMPVEEVMRRLSGIRCGMRSTSCPDQLAKAVQEAIQSQQ